MLGAPNPQTKKKMQAIETKYFPATNSKGSRIKAECDRGSITIDYPHELSGDDVHRVAVQKLCEKFASEDLKQYGTPVTKNPWMRQFLSGGLKRGTMVHVFVD